MSDDFIIRVVLDARDAAQSARQLAGAVEELQKRFGNDAGLRKAIRGISEFGIATEKGANKQQAAAQAAQKHAQGLSTTRYALYDVSQTLTIAGAAMVALTAATYGAAIAFERDFANVIRTSGVTGDAIGRLRDDFIDLGQTIPVSISELSQIGTLGGQLGIAANDLANFTSVVARFSATTDLNIDKAATAFGRLKALLPDVADGTFSLEALASSILKVGINSVATESDITNIATQLSSMAGYAGLTADELIGLAGALASVGTQPELARGTVTRLFTQMGKAVSEGGDKLASFANTAGVSSEVFAKSFGTNKFGPIFLRFVEGLGNVEKKGGDVVSVLKELGITSVRDVPALTRLANAANSAGVAGGLLAQTMGDAASGIKSASELSDQYAIIAGTVAAKLQLLVQNFQLLLVAIGDGGSVFGLLLDVLNNVLRTLTDLASNPATNAILQLTVMTIGLLGVLALVVGVGARAVAGLIAITQAMTGLTGASAGASVSLGTVLTQLAATGPLGAKAAAGIRILTGAMKGLGLITLAFVLPEIAQWAGNAIYEMRGLGDSTKDAFKRLEGFKDTSWADTWGTAASNLANDIGFFANDAARDFRQVGEAITAAFSAGDLNTTASGLEKVMDLLDVDLDEAIDRTYGLRDAMKQQEITASLAADGTIKFSAAAGTAADSAIILAEAEALATERAEQLALALGLDSADAFEQFQKDVGSASAAFVDFDSIMSTLQERSKTWAEAQAEATSSSKDSWQDFYVSVNIGDFAKQLEDQIAAQAIWATNMATLSQRGASALVTQLAKMGPEGAQLAAQAVELTTAELMKLEGNARIAGELASGAQVEGWAANNELLARVMAEGGVKAVNGMIAAQQEEARTGVPGAVATFVETWNRTYRHSPISMPAYADTSPADRALQGFINRWGNRTIPMRIAGVDSQGGVTRANGGPIYGPGTSTSDSIPARLSHGEYVIRASSVRKYGMGMFDQLNRGVAKFANGGPVSRRTAGGGGAGSGIMELGPHSLNRIGGAPQVNVFLTDEAIARAANRGNKKIVASGGRP